MHEELEHRDGVPWWEAELPPRFHRCRAQTTGWLHFFTKVERCACGATRIDGRFWFGKNETRKARQHAQRGT